MLIFSLHPINKCYKVSIVCPNCNEPGVIIYSRKTAQKFKSLPVRHGNKICRVKTQELKKAIKPYLVIDE